MKKTVKKYNETDNILQLKGNDKNNTKKQVLQLKIKNKTRETRMILII